MTAMLSATATVASGGSLSALGHFDVGDQYTYAAGGESRHGGEKRACFRCRHRRTDGSVIRVVQVDRAVSRRRTPIFFRPDLRRLEPEISRYSPSGLQLLRLIGGFEGVRVGGVVIDDRDLGFGQWISLTSLVVVMSLAPKPIGASNVARDPCWSRTWPPSHLLWIER